MKFIIADTFQKSLAKLDGASQTLVKQSAFDFQMNPAHPGLKFHRIDRAIEKRFWSFRVNRDIRIIVFKSADEFVLLYTDHHDQAYAWAERRRKETHPSTGAAQIVEVLERTEEIVTQVVTEIGPAIFQRYAPDYLEALGVPPAWVAPIRHMTEDEFADSLDRLPQEAAERLLELASGNPVPVPVGVSATSGFLHPDAMRRFRVLDDQSELRSAMEYPWEQWTVFLHPSQRQVVDRDLNGPGRVSGTAGTGKTVAALHRAGRLAKENSSARVLLTTFSKTLAHRLRKQADILLGIDSDVRRRVEVVHLHKKAVELWSRAGRPQFRAASEAALNRLFEAATTAHSDGLFSAAFARAEFDSIIDAYGILDWETYKTFARTGRGMQLGARQRLRVWSVCEDVRSKLAGSGRSTWNQLCHGIAADLLSASNPAFEHVIADESQDFGPSELTLLRALVRPGPNDLFLAGDVGQRIYKGPFSWLALGVDVRGRSSRLRVNYRTTEEIRRYADGMMTETLEDPDGEERESEGVSLLRGPDPEVAGFESKEDEIEAVAAFISSLLDRGFAPGHIAIFGRSEEVLWKRAVPAIREAGVSYRELSDEDIGTKDAVSAGTMHRAKGLEFRAVVIMGSDQDLLPLRSVLESISDAGDREVFVAQERNLLYVACTRARERLLITYVGTPSALLPEPVAGEA